MDVHDHLPEGATAADVAQAHAADLRIQERFGVRYLNYWVDEGAGRSFCLIDAPSADPAHAVHREAHGLVADGISPVTPGYPPQAGTSEGGFPVRHARARAGGISTSMQPVASVG